MIWNQQPECANDTECYEGITTQLENILLETEDLEPHCLIVIERVGSLDQVGVKVEGKEYLFPDSGDGLKAAQEKLSHYIPS